MRTLSPIISQVSVNYSNPLLSKLTGWWLNIPAHKGGTRFRDLLGLHHGTFNGIAAPATATSGLNSTIRQGGFGEIRFDGSNDYVDNSGILSTFITNTDGTMTAWFNLRANGSSQANAFNLPGIVTDSIGAFAGIHVGDYTGNGDNIWIYLWDGASRTVGMTYTLNTWIHVAWVHTGGTLFGYKNGIQIGSVGAAGIEDVTNAFVTGAGLLQNAAAKIDDVRTWKRGLSPSEVAAVYIDSLNGYTKTLNRASKVFNPPALSSQNSLLTQRVFNRGLLRGVA